MAVIDFYLYRIKLIFPSQLSYLHENLSRQEIVTRILDERPTVVLRKRYNWHIGNVLSLDEYGGYFAAGRTTKSMVEKYDEESGNFIEEPLETSPYTHVFFDNKIGLIAIARKLILSPKPSGIARAIAHLFESTDVIIKNNITILLEPISDPRDFIHSIKSAHAIKLFEVTLSRPNPEDVEEFLQKPVEKYIEAANAEKGKVAVLGTNLNPDTIVRVTESIAASGDDARAVLRSSEEPRFHSLRLKDNPAHIDIDEDKYPQKAALAEIRKLYRYVRGRDDDLEND